MLKELFEQLYHKLKKEERNDKKSKNGCFDFFVNVILKNDAYKVDNFSITSKAIKNYYEKYVEERDNKSGEPKSELKLLIAKYLGFLDYTDFENHNKKKHLIKTENYLKDSRDKTIESNKSIISKNYKNKSFIKKHTKAIISSSILTVVALIFFINKKYNNNDFENCIIWKENHFETSPCNSKNAIDNTIYKITIDKFNKVEVNNKTQFFKNGKPLIWYGKSSKGKMEFFTERGIHPETLNELHPITESIINKYIFTKQKDKTILN